MTKKATLIFDIDNTLIDRDKAFLRYITSFIERYSIHFDIPHSEVFDTIIELDCRGRKDRSLFCKELIQRFPALPIGAEQLWEDHQNLPLFVEPNVSVTNLLQMLTLDFQLMILSNGSSRMQREKIRMAGIEPFFEQIFISGECGICKPHVKIFKMALEKADFTPIVMIGDDYQNDILPAINLGLQTIWINPEKQNTSLAPDFELNSITELSKALQCIL